MTDDQSSIDPRPKSWIDKIAQVFSDEPTDTNSLLELLRNAAQDQVLDGQAFKLRYDDMLDVLTFQHLSIAIDQVLHVPHGHGFEAAQICTNVMGEEAVGLTFAGVLGSELLCGHHLELSRSRIDLVDLFLTINVV